MGADYNVMYLAIMPCLTHITTINDRIAEKSEQTEDFLFFLGNICPTFRFLREFDVSYNRLTMQ